MLCVSLRVKEKTQTPVSQRHLKQERQGQAPGLCQQPPASCFLEATRTTWSQRPWWPDNLDLILPSNLGSMASGLDGQGHSDKM